MELERSDLEQLDRPAVIRLVLTLQARLAALEAQVAELRGEPPAPPATGQGPSFGRPARPARPAKGARQQRSQHFARRREPPTQLIEHVIAVCPACGTALAGGEVVQRRQVLHVPRVPVQVIEHVVRRRICPHCNQAHTPRLDLGDQVLGQHRVSLETMAYIASLHTVGRLPVRTIQWLLDAVHGLHLSVGGAGGDPAGGRRARPTRPGGAAGAGAGESGGPCR